MIARCGPATLMLLLAGVGCTSINDSPEALYQQAGAALRRGELDKASDTAARAASGASQDERLSTQVRLLRAEIALAQGQPAVALELAGTAVPAAFTDTSAEARHAKVLAQVDMASRRLPEAATRLARAESVARRVGDEVLLREVLLLDGLRLSAGGDTRARARTEEAFENARAAGDRYWQAAALNNLALLRFRAFDYDGALSTFERALQAAREIGAQRFAAASLTNIGPCYYRLGDLGRARQALEEAARIQEEIGARGNLQASLGELGNLAFLEGDTKTAAEFYRRAIALARTHAPADASRWEGNLAAVFMETGAWQEARQLNAQVAAAREAAGDTAGLAYTRLHGGVIASRQGNVAEAERMLADAARLADPGADAAWEAAAELAVVAATRGDRATAAKYFEAALGGIEATRAGLRRDHQIAFLQPRLRFYQRYVQWLVDQGQTDRALAVVESSRVQMLASQFGRGARVSRIEPAALLRVATRERAVLLSYWVTPNASFVWVVSQTGTELIRLPGEGQISQLVQAYRTFLESGVRDPLSTAFAPAEQLYELLIAPVSTHLQGATRVIIAPDGPLHALPFDALVVGGVKPHYWIEDITIAIAPSLALLAESPTRSGSTRALLAFGAPQPEAAGLPPLPHADDELAAVAARHRDVTLIKGRDATPEAFASATPAHFARIHFASHAIANPASPLDSAIVTAPGAGGTRLLARTLLDMRLSADIVTISACRSAGARVIAGEGLVGFAWVLLHAGARHVVAGLWDVNDRSTADLMARLYGALDEKMPPASALRAAKLALLADGRFKHPFYWAPFTVFVGPGQSRQTP